LAKRGSSNDTLARSRRSQLRGVVILSVYFQLSLSKYKAFIRKTESFPLFKSLQDDNLLARLHLPKAYVDGSKETGPSDLIAQFRKEGEGFAIEYTSDEFRRFYSLAPEVWEALATGKEGGKLVRCLWVINARNAFTHLLLMGIIHHQEDFLLSGSPLKLKPLSQVALARWIKAHLKGDSPYLPPGFSLNYGDNSTVCRLVGILSVLTPQGMRLPLKTFFPRRQQLYSQLIKAILDEEEEAFREGKLRKAYTDEEIRQLLKQHYGVSLSRRTVSLYRQALGIPASRDRGNQRIYPPPSVYFSLPYPFERGSINANAPESPGVYEIALAEGRFSYPLCSSAVIYIGSTHNLRKRLKEHLFPNARKADLANIQQTHKLVFRYMILPREKIRSIEKLLCNSFTSIYGALPRCNHLRP